MNEKILIIDDDQYICSLLEDFLIDLEYHVKTFWNATDGIAYYKEQGARVVILDILMPDKDGLETIRDLKAFDPAVKIICISGGGRIDAENYLQLALKMGAQYVMHKPFSVVDFQKRLEELL